MNNISQQTQNLIDKIKLKGEKNVLITYNPGKHDYKIRISSQLSLGGWTYPSLA